MLMKKYGYERRHLSWLMRPAFVVRITQAGRVGKCVVCGGVCVECDVVYSGVVCGSVWCRACC